jgi:hypothetical protein
MQIGVCAAVAVVMQPAGTFKVGRSHQVVPTIIAVDICSCHLVEVHKIPEETRFKLHSAACTVVAGSQVWNLAACQASGPQAVSICTVQHFLKALRLLHHPMSRT